MRLSDLGAVIGTALFVSACVGTSSEVNDDDASDAPFVLADTHWQLVEISSEDDISRGPLADPEPLYTVLINADGSAAFRFDCNRGIGRWQGRNPAADGIGMLSFSEIGVTRALCHPDSISDQVESSISNIRAFSLDAGRLILTTGDNSPAYQWIPYEEGS